MLSHILHPIFDTPPFDAFCARNISGKRTLESPSALENTGFFRVVAIITYGHSNATALIEAGVSAKVVQQRLGHSDVTTTLNIYTHATKTMEKAAADTLEALIFGEKGNDVRKASNG